MSGDLSPLKALEEKSDADMLCSIAQLMDSWKSSDPSAWSEHDQALRDWIKEKLAASSVGESASRNICSCESCQGNRRNSQ